MLTPLERELLKAARERIRDGRNTYICMALQDMAIRKRSKKVNKAVIRLRRYIEGSLHPYNSLTTWQRNRRIYRDSNLVRLDRIRWIDWMLGDITDEQLNQMMRDWS